VNVAELWRYPVKSLQGERLEEAPVGPGGIEGDRRYALFDLDTGLGLTARRVPELLFATARLRDDGAAEITLPDGSTATGDDALSRWLGRRVALRAAGDDEADGARRYECPSDNDLQDAGPWFVFQGAGGPFHDAGQARVSLVSTATLSDWDRRRFRANVVLDGAGEDDLVGTRVQLGEAVLDVGMRLSRCVMTTRAQPGGIERDPGVLRTIARERDACLAIGALVRRPGVVRVGDRLTP
jgi:uncharacterized protein YcbX